jgi:ABC-2 type transport system permease protein
MPIALQLVTTIVPARYFLVALRGVLLKGSGIEIIYPQLIALAVFAVLVMTMAARRLRKDWA